MSVFSYYIEKKAAYADEALALLAELRLLPEQQGITRIRVIHRFYAEGSSISELKNNPFSDPAVDIVYDTLPDFGSSHVLAVELLPGQFDKDADSFAQCLALASGKPRPLTRSAKIYVFEGNISSKNFNTIKTWLINPIESRESSLCVPDTLVANYGLSKEVAVIDGFTSLDEHGLKEMMSELSLAMDLTDLTFCQAYFKDEEQRNPTITEIRVIDTYWSDHCRHTTFLTELENIDIADEAIQGSYEHYLSLRSELLKEDKPITLMDLATIGARVLKARELLCDLDESEEVNACSVKIKVDVNGKPQDWLLMFKNETHNHPTEMEPFGGAETCLGGAIRDPMSGRSYVYQAMRITGAGNPLVPLAETLPGKLPQRKICRSSAAGYSSYGNQVGVATGHVHEIYHPGYVAKRMELGAVIGAAPAINVVRERPSAGDVVILLGGKTGRDGCGGATGSSKSHEADSLETSGAEVQRGNAPEERKIIRLFRNPEATRLIKRCNDFGAGGVSVAIGELADGLSIDLDKVPVKYCGLDGTELAISESQERMAIVVEQKDVNKFIELADSENLDAVAVATVTDESRMTMTWNGKEILNLSRSFLNSNGATKYASVKVSSPVLKEAAYPELERDSLLELMGSLPICSQKGLIDHFDYSIGASTLLAPLGGLHRLTPSQIMAAKLPVLNGDTSTCSLMSWGFDPFISEQSPYHGGKTAVIHSIAKIIASGGSRKKCWLTFQEYFERLLDDPTRWGKPFAALLGALDAQIGLECGAVGGKDSMSGSFEGIDVPPTLVSFAVAVADSRNIISTEFKEAGSKVYFLNPGFDAFDKSDFSSLRTLFDSVEQLIADGKVKSAWAVSAGGTAEAVIKMGFGNQIGFTAKKPLTAQPAFGGLILESDDLHEFEDCLLGATEDDYTLTLSNGQRISMSELQTAWEQTLEPVYPSREEQSNRVKVLSYKSSATLTVSGKKTHSPQFVIPVFPGANSEYDIERAIAKAGGIADTFVIRNRNECDIVDSIRALEQAINSAQGIVLPSGDGSASFIVSLFMNTAINNAVADLLQKRDGLICGIGAGFRALVKLGLLPYGEIQVSNTTSFALTNNKVGRHQSVMANIQVVSSKSPFLGGFDIGETFVVPVSSEYSRFVGDESLIHVLAENGQIATQYVDLDGNPTMDMSFNPGPSDFAIAGCTSLDGRVFGCMSHGERCRGDLFVNVPGNKDMDIFRGAVGYYK